MAPWKTEFWFVLAFFGQFLPIFILSQFVISPYCNIFCSDAARELISREFSRISVNEILENEFCILEKLIFQKYVVVFHFEDFNNTTT